MAAYAVKARWLLDEASSGTSPTTCADDTGNANTFAIDYSSGDANWASVAAGNGLDFTATANSANSAIAELDDLSANGTLGTDLKNQKEISFRVVMDLTAGHSNGMRVMAMGTNSGNTDLSLIAGGSNVMSVRWNEEGGSGATMTYPGLEGSGLTVVDVVINTAEGTGADRIAVYYNGSAQTAGGNTITQNQTLTNIDSSGSPRSFSIGNRPSQNRNPEVTIYYAEIGTGVLSASEIADYTNLTTDNDSDWQSSGAIIMTIAESVAIVDSESARLSAGMTVAEAVASTDADAARANFNQTLAEALAASDLVSAIKQSGSTAYNMTIGEAVASADNVSISANFKLSISESASAIDGVSNTSNFVTTISESLSASDSVVTFSPTAYTLTLSESASITDLFSFAGDAGVITATITITQIVSGDINDNPLINGEIDDKPLIDGEINDNPVISGTITVS